MAADLERLRLYRTARICGSAREVMAALRDNVEAIRCENVWLSSEELQQIGQAMAGGDQVRFLLLHANKIGTTNADILAALPQLPNLRTLVITDNGLNLAGGEAVVLALRQLPDLEELNLGGNNLSPAGAEVLAKALPQLRLQKLDLSNNDLNPEGAEALAQALLQLPGLLELNLSGNSLSSAGAEALAPALPHLLHLQNLDLSNNDLDFAGVEALAEVLPQLLHLEKLDLSNNDLDFAGAEVLAEVLPQLEHLQKLHLSNNDLNLAEAEILAQALLQMPGLYELNLSGNSLYGAGVEALAEVLPELSGLRCLHLGNNNIVAPFAQETLARALEENASITELYGDWSHDIQNRIDAILARNEAARPKVILALRLEGNSVVCRRNLTGDEVLALPVEAMEGIAVSDWCSIIARHLERTVGDCNFTWADTVLDPRSTSLLSETLGV